jgi:hypothetical protein
MIGNRRRALDWLLQIYFKAPPSGQTYIRSDFKTLKIANNLNYTFLEMTICVVYNILHMLAFSG